MTDLFSRGAFLRIVWHVFHCSARAPRLKARRIGILLPTTSNDRALRRRRRSIDVLPATAKALLTYHAHAQAIIETHKAVA